MTPRFDKYIEELRKKYGNTEVSDGMEVEKEHDDVTHGDKLERAKIVNAHLKEKPNYYELLNKYVEN